VRNKLEEEGGREGGRKGGREGETLTLVRRLVHRHKEHALGGFHVSAFGGDEVDDELLGVDQVLGC